jgi:hypothetical protein
VPSQRRTVSAIATVRIPDGSRLESPVHQHLVWDRRTLAIVVRLFGLQYLRSDRREPQMEKPQPRHTRRLSDKILIAFHHACDGGDVEVAASLLDVLAFMIDRPPHLPDGSDRRAEESLVAAHERLWQILHPGIEC